MLRIESFFESLSVICPDLSATTRRFPFASTPTIAELCPLIRVVNFRSLVFTFISEDFV